ncbi:MAG: histidine kinase [Chitinophagales bacterium]|nr:histidine kinase [Chitinophagales bacterium]
MKNIQQTLEQITSLIYTDTVEASRLLTQVANDVMDCDDSDIKGLYHNLLGIIAYLKNDISRSLNQYLIADSYLKTSKLWKNRIKPQVNIAMLYSKTNQDFLALDVYMDIVEQLKDIPMEITHAQMYINIDTIYYNIHDYAKGSMYAKKAYEIATLLNHDFGIALSASNLAGHLLHLGEMDDARKYLLVSTSLAENNFENLLCSIYYKLAKVHLHQKDYIMTFEYLDKGIPITQKYNNKYELYEYYLIYAQLYEEMGNDKLALEKYKLFHQFRDEWVNDEKIKTYNQLQLQYETEKKEVRLKDLKIKQQESELTALKAQMNPHFIFNTLNSIQSLYMKGLQDIANEQMGNFSLLTRKILEASGKQEIALSEELEILIKYLELESIRFDQTFHYSIQISPDIDDDYIKIPPMLIQPYIENSIKHGLFHKTGSKELNVVFEICEEENLLYCTIHDNGIGRVAANEINKRRMNHSSFATSATEKRLQLLNDVYESKFSVSYEDKYDEYDKASGTNVVLKIPI